MNSTKNRTHSPWIFRPRQLPPEPCWDNLHGSVLFLLSILFHSIPPALKLLPHSSLPGLVFQHCSSLITNPWQIENSVFKPCLNPHAAQAKSNKQWIVKSHNMWHRWTCFLKETKLLALKRLETIIGKHLCLVSSKMVRPQLSFIWAVFLFPTSDGSGAGTTRGESLFSHIQVCKQVAWESAFSTCCSPLTSLSKANCTQLSPFRKSLGCQANPGGLGVPEASPEPHFAIETKELPWSKRKFWNELFLYFQKSGLSL